MKVSRFCKIISLVTKTISPPPSASPSNQTPIPAPTQPQPKSSTPRRPRTYQWLRTTAQIIRPPNAPQTIPHWAGVRLARTYSGRGSGYRWRTLTPKNSCTSAPPNSFSASRIWLRRIIMGGVRRGWRRVRVEATMVECQQPKIAPIPLESFSG